MSILTNKKLKKTIYPHAIARKSLYASFGSETKIKVL